MKFIYKLFIQNSKRIVGSTLLEVIVAMLIANIVFLFSISIVMNTLAGNPMIKKYKSQLITNSYVANEFVNKDSENITIEWDSATLKKEVLPMGNKPGLSIIIVTITDKNGRQLAKSRSIIRNGQN